MGIDRIALVDGAIPGESLSNARRGEGGFTLIELLVGFVILTILVTLMLSVFSNFSQVTSASTKRMEAGKQSRTVFDRMAFDIGSAVKSGGVKMLAKKNGSLDGGTISANDAMVLLTEAKTRDADSRMAKVGYGVGTYFDQSRGMTNQTILRYVQTFSWTNDTTKIDIANSAGDPVVDAQAIAPGVIRFELSFVDADGKIVADPPTEGTAAIICTVATLDQEGLRKLPEGQRKNIVDELVTKFPDATNGLPPLASWQAVDVKSYPLPVVQGLRFQQRYFQLK